MQSLRAFLQNHLRFAALLLACALAMKALVPSGYMLGGSARVLTVHLCGDQVGGPAGNAIAVPLTGKHDDGGKGHSDTPCPYSALGHAALSGTDPVQLALALLFIFALGFLPLAAPNPARIAHLRPPLRGPPPPA